MLRRSALRTVGGLLPLLVAGCDVPQRPRTASPEAPVLRPAQQLALALAELPPGFRQVDELAPKLSATGPDDPWGRVSAYSVTYAPSEPRLDFGDIMSSVNAYSSAQYAQLAFDSWQAAVPRQYRATTVDVGLAPADVAAYVRDGACLLGFRTRNVMASVLVTHRTGASVEHAARFVRLLVEKISRSAR